MAKRVTVAELQAMGRGAAIDETEIIDPANEDAAATEALKRIGAPVNGQGDFIDALAEATADGRVGEIGVTPADGINAQTLEAEAFGIVEDVLTSGQAAGSESSLSDEAPKSEPSGSRGWMLQQLRFLEGKDCSEEMTLGMVIDRVRDKAQAVGLEPTDAEIVAEAERIFGSFIVNRKGPGVGDTGLTQARIYDVDATGEVRDWRRPDTTPDRGDVTEVHTATDDEPRFSGGGAEDQAADLYAVPTDQQFAGRLYRDAPDLANIAEKLIGEHGHLSELINAEIRFYWRRKSGVSKGRVKIGYCKRASDLLGHFSGADFLIWLSATTARNGKFSPRQVEAAVFHQLCHIETDDEGNFISARHDFEGFAAEIRHYGTWTEDLKLGGTAFVAAHQMGLFDVDAEDDDEDDEIQENRPHDAFMGAADPDGPSPEDEDILADPAVI